MHIFSSFTIYLFKIDNKTSYKLVCGATKKPTVTLKKQQQVPITTVCVQFVAKIFLFSLQVCKKRKGL